MFSYEKYSNYFLVAFAVQCFIIGILILGGVFLTIHTIDSCHWNNGKCELCGGSLELDKKIDSRYYYSCENNDFLFTSYTKF